LLRLLPDPSSAAAFVFSPTVVRCAIINATNATLPGVPWRLLNFCSACWNQSLATQEMIACDQSFIPAWSRGPPFDLAMSNIWKINGNINVFLLQLWI
jgi:hypothetical protein